MFVLPVHVWTFWALGLTFSLFVSLTGCIAAGYVHVDVVNFLITFFVKEIYFDVKQLA